MSARLSKVSFAFRRATNRGWILRFLLYFCLVVSGWIASPASAQRYWGADQIPYCSPATSADACRAESLDLLLSKLQLPSADSLARDGVKAVRVFRYDAFGTIWPAVSIHTKPVNEHRRDGAVQARSIEADGRLAALERPVWELGWREMDDIIVAILERPPVEYSPEPASGIIPPRCLDPPTVVVEVIAEGQVHRWWPDMCKASTAVAQSDRIAQLIAAAFPACGHFSIERYGRGLGRVRACLLVEGEDSVAAAEVMEILRPNIGGDTRVIYEAEHQSEGVRLLGIDGRRTEGRTAVLEALKAGALGDRWFRVVRAEGDKAGVTVVAQLRQTREANNPDPLAVSTRWVREADGNWRIINWAVEQR